MEPNSNNTNKRDITKTNRETWLRRKKNEILVRQNAKQMIFSQRVLRRKGFLSEIVISSPHLPSMGKFGLPILFSPWEHFIFWLPVLRQGVSAPGVDAPFISNAFWTYLEILKKYAIKCLVHILTCYMLIKLFQQKSTCFVSCVKKTNFGVLDTKFFLFLHRTQKCRFYVKLYVCT
jgi:hypothetical protein